MAYEFSWVHRVEFYETDRAGIVHFSNFFRYMESAESAFFRSLNLSIVTRAGEAKVGWPRVQAACDYRHPLRFEDEVEVRLLVAEKRSKAISYLFKLHRRSPGPVVEVAVGRVTVVCVMVPPGGAMRSTHIPPEIADLIEVAPAALLR